MSNGVLSQSDRLTSPMVSGIKLYAAIGLAVWLGLVFLLGEAEVFVTRGGAPPLALSIALTTPIILFLAALWTSNALREIVFTADLSLMTAIQAWRIGGFTFLALYAYGILPGYFAWPAGLGDMAIGITAPWLIVALIRRPSFAASKTYLAWNLFGILDLVVAVGLGVLGPRFLSDASGVNATAPMAHLPFVLIPTFFVPLFIILHVAALVKSRSLLSIEHRHMRMSKEVK